MTRNAYFGPGVFQFLVDLKAHNDRDWFLANKARFEEQARDPFLRLIADLRPGFEKISPRIVVDPSTTRGSMLRIYRDIRFSANKTPYKTHLSAHFWHAKAKPEAVPGYYIHVEPEACMLGAGAWRPEPRGAQKIRNAIVADPKRWKQVRSKHNLVGETLKRAPGGIDPQHPLIDDLKRKSFEVTMPLKESDVCSPNLLKVILAAFQSTAPYVQFLTEAVGLK
jgi:uncharacterized protein (TIGR02453 family)